MKRKTKIIIAVIAVLLVIGITIGIIAAKSGKEKNKEITETTISTTESTTENTTETAEDILTTAESETETEATSASQTKTAPAKTNSNSSNKSSASNNNKSASSNSNKSYNSSNSTPKPETTTKQQTDNREHPANGTVIYSRPNASDYYDYGKNWQYAENTYEWKVDEYGGYWSCSTTSKMSYENLVKYVDNNLQEPDREGSYAGEKVLNEFGFG
ncbi:hypothetical protein [uncultured Eubacterium sp.]|uniref:hypothetical protein n=1 Tax=uncultured Eubacterium sp. TaxID=165185 RepID=UPI0015A8D41F|nr:hypothetical protein [uncultured Eubacterium sp.]